MYDLLIIGGGPAGLSAAMTARNRNLSVCVICGGAADSALYKAGHVTNYPGVPDVSGPALLETMTQQARALGADILHERALSAMPMGKTFGVSAGKEFAEGRALLLATGIAQRGTFPGEAEFLGRGVSYCATCDGSFFRGKTVMVVGGGNTAAADAIYLSRLAERVILVHRRDKLRATPIYHDQLAKLENVSFMWSTEVRALHGEDGKLVSAQVEHLGNGALETVPVDGVFVAVGTQPNTEFLADALPLDTGGYISASETGETSIPGVFAAGDVRAKALRQVVTAVSDGAVCAERAANYVAI